MLSLPVVHDAFDLVVIYGAIHHYHELRQSIHELARVARAACAMSEPALMGLLQHPINLLGWNTEYGGIQTARLSESQLNPLFQEVGMDVVYDRQFQYFPPAFERAGNWKPFVQGWFFFLKLLDRMLPSSWAHSISFYAAKNKP